MAPARTTAQSPSSRHTMLVSMAHRPAIAWQTAYGMLAEALQGTRHWRGRARRHTWPSAFSTEPGFSSATRASAATQSRLAINTQQYKGLTDM